MWSCTGCSSIYVEESIGASYKEMLASIVQKKLQKGDSVEKIADDLMEDITVIEEIVIGC